MMTVRMIARDSDCRGDPPTRRDLRTVHQLNLINWPEFGQMVIKSVANIQMIAGDSIDSDCGGDSPTLRDIDCGALIWLSILTRAYVKVSQRPKCEPPTQANLLTAHEIHDLNGVNWSGLVKIKYFEDQKDCKGHVNSDAILQGGYVFTK